jgi:hypothetical protein
MELLIRADAAQAVIDKFFERKYELGKRDCCQMAAFCIQQLGHPDPLKGVKSYKTPLGARKAMRAAGVRDFAEYLDERFERIGYASALPGDLIGLPGRFHDAEPPSTQLGVFIGNGRIIGFANGIADWADAERVVSHAWRIPVLRGDA